MLLQSNRPSDRSDVQVLRDIRFGFLCPYKVAGMGEPWFEKMAQTQRLLAAQGIGGILTLTEDDLYGSLHRDFGFIHHHEPIDDTCPPTTEGMDRAIAFIDKCLDDNRGVAVHCQEGRGRTGTVLCGWVGLKETLSPKEAIIRIHELRWETVLTPSQKSFLRKYLDRSPTNRQI